MARTKTSSDDRAAWRHLKQLAEKHGWDDDDDDGPDEPTYRVHFMEGTKAQLQEWGFWPADSDDTPTEDEDTGTEEPEDDKPETEPKPKSRNRYFGGR